MIFTDVRLQAGDDLERLKVLGLAITKSEGRNPRTEQHEKGPLVGLAEGSPKSEIRNPRFTQPCAALEGCRCRIYAERPTYCRQFECLLLKSVKAGQTQRADALRTIRRARSRAEKVRVLLRTLGDGDEHLALSARFRRVKRRMDKGELGSGMAGAYGELTLAVQDLNVVLSEGFYPGDGLRDA